MAWTDINSKFKTLTEAQTFTLAKEKFDFSYVPDCTVDRSYMIMLDNWVDPREADDINMTNDKVATVRIMLAYRLTSYGSVTGYDSIPTELETLEATVTDPDNFATGVILTHFVQGKIEQFGEQAPYYLIAELTFNVHYRI